MKNTMKKPVNIPVSKLRPFEGHPFKVKDDAEMNTLFLNMRIKDFPATIPTAPIFSVCSTILKWVRSVPSSATN